MNKPKKSIIAPLILTIISSICTVYAIRTTIEISSLKNIGTLESLGIIILLPMLFMFSLSGFILSLISLITLKKKRETISCSSKVIFTLINILLIIAIIVAILITIL